MKQVKKWVPMECPDCYKGNIQVRIDGKWFDEECESCEASGEIYVYKTVTITDEQEALIARLAGEFGEYVNSGLVKPRSGDR